MNIHSHRAHGAIRLAATAAGLTGALLIAACATTPPEPTVALKAAEQAIATADRTPATSVAPELTEARTKLTAAQGAAAKKDMALSERLAMESRIDAELALAKSQAAAAKTVNDEMKRSNATLAQEMQRTSGVK